MEETEINDRSTFMNKVDGLIISSTAKWVYEDFKATEDLTVPLHFSPGIILPKNHGFHYPALWANLIDATRMQMSGFDIPLMANPHSWAELLPEHLSGRTIVVSTFAELKATENLSDKQYWWTKLSEVKDLRIMSMRRTLPAFINLLTLLGAPEDTLVEYSYPVLPIVREDRFFVVNHQVVTGSPYSQFGILWSPLYHDHPDWQYSQTAADFAQYVATSMQHTSAPSYVLDIGRVMSNNPTSRDYHVVVEANHSWCSAYYGADIKSVATALINAVDYDNLYPHCLWEPDPWLKKRAQEQSPLV